jgi:rifampicin phosphotransferase
MTVFVADRFATDNVAAMGGKASALAALANAGLPVPPWFVVLPSAFEASVPPTLVPALADVAVEDAAGAAAAGIRVAADVRDAIAAALAGFPDHDRFAVRSSAQDEDSSRHSFAGQLESFLGVQKHDVCDYVMRVWASGFGARVARYRSEAGFADKSGVPAVIVQLMVEGEASGVAFSADPVSGRRAITVVAAVKGRGSALVLGEVAGDTWRVDRAGNIVEQPGTGPHAVLDEADVRRVAALARQAERHFGLPQDIEWTLAGGTLHLLQSRPITTLAAMADPDAPRAVWDNSNIIESYSGITTPLTFSFARRGYEHAYREFCRLLGIPEAAVEARSDVFGCMLGLVRGRVYYNLLNWYRLLALVPGYEFNRQFMEQMMGVREPLARDGVAGLESRGFARRLVGALQLARTLGLLAWRIATLRSRMRTFEARLDEALGTTRPDLTLLRADELAATCRRIEGRLLAHWDAPLVNDFATMLFHGLLRRLAASWIGGASDGLANDLLRSERGMTSEAPARRVREIAAAVADDAALVDLLCEGSLPRVQDALATRPAAAAAFAAYIDRYGERCLEELKLESRTLFDDPLPLYRGVGRCARGLARSPRARPAETCGDGVRADAERRVRRALRHHLLRRAMFAWTLRRTRRHVGDRERLRFERTRVFGRARHLVVEIGRRLSAIDLLDAPRDVFFLEYDEVLACVENRATTTDLRGLVAVRRAEIAAFAKLPAPADRFETRGIACRGNAFDATRPSPPPAGDSITGVACSPGIVRGSIRLVRDPSCTALVEGEIVLAERTDPGWVMVFPAAAGLLVERGSLLSHSAIVARELGLPTIVALPGVTQWLHDGDVVEMDGSTGRVTRLANRAAADDGRGD